MVFVVQVKNNSRFSFKSFLYCQQKIMIYLFYFISLVRLFDVLLQKPIHFITQGNRKNDYLENIEKKP